MKIHVLFFGATADIADKREVELMVTDGMTTNEVLKNILRQFPRLSNHKLHISINQQYASGSETVNDGDELAIFTAVSGG